MIYRCPNCDSMDFRKKDGKFICVRCDKSYAEDYLVECAKQEEEKLSSLKHLLSGDKVDKGALDELREEMHAGFDEIKSQNESHHEETIKRFDSLDDRLVDIKESLQNGTMSLADLITNASASGTSDEAAFIYKNSLDEILGCVKNIEGQTENSKRLLQSLKARFDNLSTSMKSLMDEIKAGKTTLSKAADEVLANDSVEDIRDLAFGVKNVIEDPEKDQIAKQLEEALAREEALKAELSAKGGISFSESMNRASNVEELSIAGFILRNAIERTFKEKYHVPHDNYGFYMKNEDYQKRFPKGTSTKKSKDLEKTELNLMDRLSYTKAKDEDKATIREMWIDFNYCVHGNIEKLKEIGFEELKIKFNQDVVILKRNELLDEGFN